MSDPIVINTLEALKQFLNEKGVLEVVIRGQKKKFKLFQKILICDKPEQQEQGLAEKVIQAINKNTHLNERSLEILGNVAKLEKIGFILNGLNLCSTCVGFVIMCRKLDKMSDQINRQLHQIQKTIKQDRDVQNDYEFNKVLADHTDMLDSQRRLQPYSEEAMRKLVDSEYNVLNLLTTSLQKDLSDDQEVMIFTIFSLLAMFTVSLRTFDEVYYFNNHEKLGDQDVWHLSHDKWMSIYDNLSSPWFVEKLQDYAAFRTSLRPNGVDVYYKNLLNQVKDLREEIEDNQTLLVAMKDVDLFRKYKTMAAQEIEDTIKKVYEEAGKEMEASAVEESYKSALKMMTMA